MYTICITPEGDAPTYSQRVYNDQWACIIESFMPNKVYFLGVEDQENFEFKDSRIFRNINYQFINNYSEILENIVIITPETALYVKGDTELSAMTHQDNMCYVFGPNESFLQCDIPSDKIYIKTKSDLQQFNWVAAAIVLYDRYIKYGNT